MPPNFRFTDVRSINDWNNWHGTQQAAVDLYCTPDHATDLSGQATPTLQRQAAGLTDIFQYCLDNGERLTTVGATWSLSDVLAPGKVVVDPDSLNRLTPVDAAMLTAAYQNRRTGTPLFVEAGIHISDLNNALGRAATPLALNTSGAGDGHRLAGCIATGTHGSAFRFGAVHDQLLAIFLMTGPRQAVLLQPADRNFTPALAQRFEQLTGIPTRDDPNDDRFNAALVGLGGLGFVHSVVLEAAPLYELTCELIPMQLSDPKLWDAIARLDPSGITDVPGQPWHFEVMINAYADPNRPTGAFVKLMWRQAGPPTRPFTPAGPNASLVPADTSRVMAALFPLASIVPSPALDLIISHVIDGQFTTGKSGPYFPGEVFGPTSLPRGNGRSTEVVFDHANAQRGIDALIQALRAQARLGRHLFGVIGIRFVPRTRALLGMNQRDQNVYVELGSLATSFIGDIHEACWQALRDAGVPFTCHWGQQSELTPPDVVAWYSQQNVTAWQTARSTLLPTPAQRALFTNPLLERVGLI